MTRLVREKYADSQTNFSKSVRVSLSQLGQWLAPEDSPHIRHMSERSARAIEVKAGLPMGWLDQGDKLEVNEPAASYSNWPFPGLSVEKIQALSRDDLMQLQAGIIFAAAELGLDIKAGKEEKQEAM